MGSSLKIDEDSQLKGIFVRRKLTNRQRDILKYIENRIMRQGQAPTIREIGKQFGITSTNGVRTHLTALIKKGYIKKQAYISRGIELSRDLGAGFARVPLVGSVPAGLPIDAVENVDSEIAVDFTLVPKGESFCLKVTGDSMKDAGILDGDVVLVKKQAVAQNGEIVVAILNGEATVKKYFLQGKQIRLQPANNDFEPIMVGKSSGDFRIAGKVVGLMRRIG